MNLHASLIIGVIPFLKSLRESTKGSFMSEVEKQNPGPSINGKYEKVEGEEKVVNGHTDSDGGAVNRTA